MTPAETAAQLRLAADWIEKSMSEQPKSFTLPTPPPGMKWHRTDGWQEGDLPQGWRPLVLNEEAKPVDEHWTCGLGPWKALKYGGQRYDGLNTKCRTRRPLTFTHAGKTWTYHRPGDPMPCDGDKMVVALTEYGTATAKASRWQWGDDQGKGNIIGWRYADAEKPDEISWIKWNGGPCPLRDEEVEEWEFSMREDGKTKTTDTPSSFRWKHEQDTDDIIAYRVLKWREKKPKGPLGPDDFLKKVKESLEMIEGYLSGSK